MVYLTLFPFLLWPSMGWPTIAFSTLIAFLLIGTENIGAQIEEPFFVSDNSGFSINILHALACQKLVQVICIPYGQRLQNSGC